ncbi:MAG: ORF6N domain-containing protein [Muribaculaceae bacterium]|nr:ORF6N domain-containing protein [Muribaculaceae bacterium]
MDETDKIIHSDIVSSPAPDLIPLENLIHVVRGQQVMIDSDLARMYGVETKRLKEQVRRNISRFPSDFMFELTKEECLRSQIATLNPGRGKHLKYMPFAFTENGVAMLSSILKSESAIEVNIRIMRAFTAMRSFLMNNAHMFKRLETIEHHQLLMQQHLSEHDRRIEEVLTRLDDKETEPIEGFFFEGQIFDAYNLISDLIRKACSRVILIDNYVDDCVLKTLDKRKAGVSAKIYTSPRNAKIDLDIKKHNAQYPKIDILHCSNVHDRFLIIDDTVYFVGGSIKDLGKKIVAFCKMHQSPDDILCRIR